MLAPVNKVNEYKEIAVGRLSPANSPINVMSEGIKIETAETKNSDKMVIIIRCLVNIMSTKEEMIIAMQVSKILMREYFLIQKLLNKESGVPIKAIHRL
ncbi:hypothetical protein MVE64_17670 [Metabacillus endolithicus]|nr:hypothetical protein [Metabacillus endolithicus]UPG62328.1 hypothetical protein MVE64_17670 [Metabacillus endolithicus]